MKLSSRLIKSTLQAFAALPLLAGLHAGAHAAPPAAVTTLDVCHNELTGNWRYSGMVAVSGAALRPASIVGVDYWVQNSVTAAGFSDTLRLSALIDTAIPASSATLRLTRYQADAAPLPLGVLRSSTRVAVADLLAPSAAPAVLLQTGPVMMETVCGCPHPTGCVRTQGYWKSKPGVAWPAPYDRDNFFYSSGLRWQQVLDTPPQGGNAYLMLAHQTIAAVLNRASGASAPASVQTVIHNAATWFASGTTPDTCSASDCATQKSWAGILDTYNNGLYPGAPGKCPE